MSFRDYDAKQDFDAVARIWKECGWIESEKEVTALKDFLKEGDTLVATLDGTPECVVHGSPGTVRYLGEELRLGAVASVNTSHVVRKLGFAKKLTARLLAKQAEAGMDVSALGIFDQGFYDKLGFGTGSYENWIDFDPSKLDVDYSFRPPKRLTIDNHEEMHAALMARVRTHGGVNLLDVSAFKTELAWTEKPFGFGYYDGPGGSLSHFIWGEMKGEYGPYELTWRAYQTKNQLLELLVLIKSLADQVTQIGMLEPGEIQMQDLLKQPFRTRRASKKGEFEQIIRASAYWQLRMLNLESCLSKTHLTGGESEFNLQLSDPVAEHLDDASSWQGLGGDYVVALGKNCSVRHGREKSLPTLKASVNAFSRMWFGVRSANSLSVTDQLEGEPELLNKLDIILCLPKPHFGWDF